MDQRNKPALAVKLHIHKHVIIKLGPNQTLFNIIRVFLPISQGMRLLGHIFMCFMENNAGFPPQCLF